eukprot:gene3000-5010_t
MDIIKSKFLENEEHMDSKEFNLIKKEEQKKKVENSNQDLFYLEQSNSVRKTKTLLVHFDYLCSSQFLKNGKFNFTKSNHTKKKNKVLLNIIRDLQKKLDFKKTNLFGDHFEVSKNYFRPLGFKHTSGIKNYTKAKSYKRNDLIIVNDVQYKNFDSIDCDTFLYECFKILKPNASSVNEWILNYENQNEFEYTSDVLVSTSSLDLNIPEEKPLEMNFRKRQREDKNFAKLKQPPTKKKFKTTRNTNSNTNKNSSTRQTNKKKKKKMVII